MSLSHMIILGILALIVIPPEQLPQMAREIAKFIYELKRSTAGIFDELKQDAMLKPDQILDQKIKEKLKDLQKDLEQPIEYKPQATNTTEDKAEKKQND